MQSLYSNSYVEVLDVASNGITAKGIALLGELLARNDNIKSLCIANNPVSREGTITLFKGLLQSW